MSIRLLQISFENIFDLYREYNSCLISFLSFSGLFHAFNWVKEMGNLLSISLGVSIFKSSPSILSSKSDSLLSTLDFCLLNFVLSAIVSSYASLFMILSMTSFYKIISLKLNSVSACRKTSLYFFFIEVFRRYMSSIFLFGFPNSIKYRFVAL